MRPKAATTAPRPGAGLPRQSANLRTPHRLGKFVVPAAQKRDHGPGSDLGECRLRRQGDVIVSRKYRFIFIKGVKVAGTSIEIALSKLCRDREDIVTPITARDELMRLNGNGDGARNYSADPEAERSYLDALRRTPVSQLPKVARLMRPSEIYFNHMPLREVLIQAPAVSGYKVIFAERNPYAKILSFLNHQLTSGAYATGGHMQSDPRDLRTYITRSFDANNIAMVKNIELYRDLNGTVSATMIRYEHLHQNLEYLARSLGAHYHSYMLPHAKKGILANGLHPLDFFDRKQIRIINDNFHEEFEAFNYRML